MMRRKSPPFVSPIKHRHDPDHYFYYFRRPGFERVPLPGEPWSPQFMAAHEAAMNGQALPVITVNRVKPGSFAALAASYFSSAIFTDMKPSTQGVYRNAIKRLCAIKDKDGNEVGTKSAARLERKHVLKLMKTGDPDKPDSANMLRKVIRAMMQHAIEIDMRQDDPTRDVKALRPKSKTGFHRFTEAEITQFEGYFPIGTKQRLALALGLFTGQARQDVSAMGPQHIRDEVLYWVRAKTKRSTGTELAIPIHAELRRVIDATPSGHLTFLVTEFGKPFTPAGFGNWFREQCDRANLHHCSFHGLRKAASVRLAEAGCTPHEIAAITGHASLKEIERYTKTADRKRLAVAAMGKIVNINAAKPDALFGKEDEKA
jgi:integrase